MDLAPFHKLDIVLVCGLPGAGKSHFSRKYFKDTVRKRINRKELRRMLFEMTNFGEQWKNEDFNEQDEYLVKHVERRIIEHYLQKDRKILIDNTSVTADSRKNYVRIAKDLNRSIGIIFLNTPVEKCMKRNRQNQDSLPEIVISRLYANVKLPDKGEGFEKVLVISDY